MSKFVRRLLSAAAVVGAFAATSASAGVIPAVLTFENPALTGLYFAGDSFTEQGFRMTVEFDFGTVDGVGVLPAPTSGNNSQVYLQSNDGGLLVSRDDGLGFNLNSFQYAFIPQNPASALATAIVAFAQNMDGSQSGFGFAFAAAVNGVNPFATANAAGLFNNIRSVEFFACSLVGNQLCTVATNNSGQFALDNLNVTTVPEPTSVALVLAALMAAGYSVRRKNVR